ncbi:MAG: GTPase ObgE [Bacteroidetes bacterium]|nr:GTPase ObgE [Bacteroidota bacterium]
MFIDYTKIEVTAGNGGDGAIAFRREKYVPKGGPSGGNGGNGGNIIIKAHHNLTTLLDFRYKRIYKAENGAPGGTSLKDGKYGNHVILKVPVGTIVKDQATKKIICDLKENYDEYILAKGGKGGKGNSNFATSTNQAPRKAELGRAGETIKIILELKLIADVGLVGFPNAGKSTFISKISAAKPKIADYPFTTLEPNLGIVKYRDYNSFIVADIPGIIEGAHKGKGLGIKFLRHIERTKILLFLIDISSEDYVKDFKVLFNELKSYSEVLSNQKIVVGLTKADIVTDEEINKISYLNINRKKITPIIFSSVSGKGIQKLLDELWKTLNN